MPYHQTYRDGPWQHDGAWPLVSHLLALLVVASLVALVVVVALRFLKTATPTSVAAAPPTVDPAVNELRLRYARGELSRDDFLGRLTDLGVALPPVEGT